MPLADLARRLAAHGLTLSRERHETHGYVSEWRLDGLGAPARFGRWASVDAWAARWLGEKPMQQIYQMNQIVVSDALAFVEAIPPASVPLFLFSPPYNLGNSSGGGMPGAVKTGHYRDDAPLGRRGGQRLRHGMGRRAGKWSGGALADGYDDYGDNLPWPEYIQWQHDLLTACWNALPENGAIYYNHKPRVLDGVLLDPARAYVPECCYLRQRIIWARAGGVNFSPSFYCPTHEEILILAKPGFRLAGKGASGAGSVWYIPQEAGTWHPAPFPLRLAEQVLETVRPSLVCDPFSGSGTVAKVAKKFGIDFIGCDRNAAYVERANAELATVRRVTLRQRTVLEAVAEQENLFDSEAA